MGHDDEPTAGHGDDDHDESHGHGRAGPDPGRWVLGPLVVGLVLGVILVLLLGVDSSVARL